MHGLARDPRDRLPGPTSPRNLPSGDREANMIASLLLTIVAAFGQETGRLSGKTTSPAGDPLSDVVVILSPSSGEGESARRMTGPEGEFVFADLPPGAYRLLAILPGYEDQTVEKVEGAGDGEN